MYAGPPEETQMNDTPSGTGGVVRLCPQRRSRAWVRGRRLLLVSLPAIAVTVLGTALAAPAMAASGPSMI
jgi:hypothetical protein